MFPDPVHDEFAGWALGFAPYGGADVGEIQYLATKVKPGDDDSFFDEFSTRGTLWRLVWINHAAGDLGHDICRSMSKLIDQQNFPSVSDSYDVHPVGVFDHVEIGMKPVIVSNAFILANPEDTAVGNVP